MLVVMILTAWVCSSTILCLALLRAAANSIPKNDELLVPEVETALTPGLPGTMAAHCAAQY
jgi:hypothetical protein